MIPEVQVDRGGLESYGVFGVIPAEPELSRFWEVPAWERVPLVVLDRQATGHHGFTNCGFEEDQKVLLRWDGKDAVELEGVKGSPFAT